MVQKSHTTRHIGWLETLTEFGSPTINYIEGKKNVIADLLSRSPVDITVSNDTIVLAAQYELVMDKTCMNIQAETTIGTDAAFLEKVKVAYKEDTQLLKMAESDQDHFMWKDKLLYFSDHGNHDMITRLCIPQDNELITAVLSHHHDNITYSHKGVRQTSLFIQRNFWIANLNELAKSYVESCLPDQQVQKQQANGAIASHSITLTTRSHHVC